MQKTALSVEFSVPVSESEKKQAQLLRNEMDALLEYMSEFHEFFDILAESLGEVESGKELVSIGNLIVKYKYKLRDHFNNVIRQLSKVLLESKRLFSETKTDQIQETIKANFSEIRLAFIDVIHFMEDYSSDDFPSKTVEKYELINKYMSQVEIVLRDEWMAHIDKNILTKVKLS